MDLNSDHRIDKRYPYEAVIRHDNLLPGVFYAAKMYNLSQGGVYFESDQILYPGEKIYIALKNAVSSSKGLKDDVRIEIKWRQDLFGSAFQYGYGARFVDADNHLLKMIATAEIDKADDRENDMIPKKDPREHPRELYQKMISFTCKNLSYQGVIVNIGRGGAFIATENKFSLGQKIQIMIPGDKKFKPLRLKGWIVRMNHKGLAVKFDRRSGKDRRRNPDRRNKRRLKA